MGGPEEIDRRVRLHIYEHIVQTGSAPGVAQTAGALSIRLAEAEDSYRRLAEGRVVVLQPASLDIRMANPFSAIPTPFTTVTAAGRSYFGNCIWDSLGILAALGSDGSVHTRCPDCGAALTLTVVGGLLGAGDTVAHYAVPAARWWDDITFT